MEQSEENSTDKENSQRSEPNKLTLGKIISYILGVLAAIAGVTYIFTAPLTGLLFIILALVALPPVNDWVVKKYNFTISGGLKFVVVIVLLGVIGATMPEDLQNSVAEDDVVGTVMEDETSTTPEATEQETEEEEWVKVTEITANSNKQSNTFTLEGGKQRVSYSMTGNDFGVCSIYVMEEGESLMENGGFPVVMVDGAQTDDTMMRKSSGDYYFDLQVANGSCAVELYELR